MYSLNAWCAVSCKGKLGLGLVSAVASVFAFAVKFTKTSFHSSKLFFNDCNLHVINVSTEQKKIS